jgi:predicted dehydrogenase
MLHRTLFEAGVHQIDYLMALFGEQPRAVQALTSDCGVTAEGSDAVVVATLEFSGGRLANLVQNRVCKGERQYFEVRADTRTASLRASFGGRARVSAGLFRSTRPHVRLELGASGLAWQEESGRRRVLARNPKDPMVFATRSVLERTLAAFREGGAPPSDGRWGRDVLEVIVACYHAAATGRRLALDSDEAKGLTDVSLGARS